jgi:hypothetical protein
MMAGNGYHWGSDWAEKLQDVAIPPVPTFDEAMSSVEERARRLVGKVRCGRKFEPAHPFVAKENRSSNGTESRLKLRTLEHDPEKWVPVFPRDKREAFARRSCSNKR